MKTCVFGGGGGDPVDSDPSGPSGRCSVVAPPLTFSPAAAGGGASGSTRSSSDHHHSLHHFHQLQHQRRQQQQQSTATASNPSQSFPDQQQQMAKPSTASSINPSSLSPTQRSTLAAAATTSVQQQQPVNKKSTGIDTLSANSLLPPPSVAGYRHIRRTSRVINNVSVLTADTHTTVFYIFTIIP
jgi:hypothetical protein